VTSSEYAYSEVGLRHSNFVSLDLSCNLLLHAGTSAEELGLQNYKLKATRVSEVGDYGAVL